MTEQPPQEPLEHVLRDSAGLDALAAGSLGPHRDPALELLAALRAEIDDDLATLRDPHVARDEVLLDLVAGGAGVRAETDAAAALLASLRAEIDAVPAALAPFATPVTATIAPERAPAPIIRLSGHPTSGRRKALRAAAAAAALVGALSTSGVAAASYSSHPGGSLYSLRVSLYGRTDDDPEVARELIQKAQADLELASSSTPVDATHHVVQAEAAIASARTTLPHLHDPAAVAALATALTAVQTKLAAVPTAPALLAQGAPTSPPAAAMPHAGATVDPSRTRDRRPSVDGAPVTGSPLPALSTPLPSGAPTAIAAPGSSPEPGASPSAIATPEPGSSESAGPVVAPTASGTPLAPTGPVVPPSDSPTGEPTATPSGGASSPVPAATPSAPVAISPSATTMPAGPTSTTGTTGPTGPTGPTTPSASASPSLPVATATTTTVASRPRAGATPSATPSATARATPKPRRTTKPRPSATPTLEPVSMVTPGVNARPDPAP